MPLSPSDSLYPHRSRSTSISITELTSDVDTGYEADIEVLHPDRYSSPSPSASPPSSSAHDDTYVNPEEELARRLRSLNCDIRSLQQTGQGQKRRSAEMMDGDDEADMHVAQSGAIGSFDDGTGRAAAPSQEDLEDLEVQELPDGDHKLAYQSEDVQTQQQSPYKRRRRKAPLLPGTVREVERLRGEDRWNSRSDSPDRMDDGELAIGERERRILDLDSISTSTTGTGTNTPPELDGNSVNELGNRDRKSEVMDWN